MSAQSHQPGRSESKAQHGAALSQVRWEIVLLAASVTGIFTCFTPFLLFWNFSSAMRGYSVVVGVGLFFFGAFMGPAATRFLRNTYPTDRQKQYFERISVFYYSLAALLMVLPLLLRDANFLYFLGPAILGFWLAHTAVLFRTTAWSELGRSFRQRTCDCFSRQLAGRLSINNGFWFAVFFILFLLDLYLLQDLREASLFELSLIVVSRFLTLAAFVLAIAIFLHLLFVVSARTVRAIMVAFVSLFPVLLVVDFMLKHIWNKTIREMFYDLTACGDFNIQKELSVSGLDLSVLEVCGLLACIVLGSLLFYYCLQKLSMSITRGVKMKTAIVLLSLSWGLVVIEQGFSGVLKQTQVWQNEHELLLVHMGIFSPPAGIEEIQVEFHNPLPPEQQQRLLAGGMKQRKQTPDIYFLMVESFRSDAITEQVAPNIHRFIENDCQQFEQTYAGSNCTTLSWFSLFHSQIALHHNEVFEQRDTRAGLQGAYPLRLLKKLGYKIHVRSAFDLGFKNMNEVTFGEGNALVDTLVDPTTLPQNLLVPQREILLMRQMQEQIGKSSEGGNFHLVCFDSTHYNYYWPAEGFTPLYPQCAKDINYTYLKPTEDQVYEVRKRYFNSVNWIDHQVEKFIQFLKDEGRYENAIIILTGDHGEEFREHGSWFHGSSLNNEQTRVPIAIKWPASSKPQRRQKIVSHLDIMPSLLDMLGVEKKYIEPLSGQSVLRPHSGEIVVSSYFRGMSGIGLMFVKEDLKTSFMFPMIWTEGTPDLLHLTSFADGNDLPVSPQAADAGQTYTRKVQENFPYITSRYFNKFQKVE